LQTFGFKTLVSRLGLGTFKTQSRLNFLLKVSISSWYPLGLITSMSCAARLSRLEDFDRDSSFDDYTVSFCLVASNKQQTNREKVIETTKKKKIGNGQLLIGCELWICRK